MFKDIEALIAELFRLNIWRSENLDKVGTPEFEKTTIAHKLVTDLIAADGGTDEQRAEAIRQLRLL